MKRTYTILVAAMTAVLAFAAAPNGSGSYYQNANNRKGAQLKTALRGIINSHTKKSYSSLWTSFLTTDVDGNNQIWDMYSGVTSYVPGSSAQGADYSKEGDSYNREHSFPQSWFGGDESSPMYTDLHHIYPTDGFVNSKRANYPFGKVRNATYSSINGFSKLGPCAISGYTGTVFEPADEYKGDFARTYFYIVTCYEQELGGWVSDFGSDTAVDDVLDGSTYPAFQLWQLDMLLDWAADDPVSQKEIDRNTAVYGIQNNRNPFIDYPGLEQYIWGSKKNEAFSFSSYVAPTEYTGYNGGSSGGQTGAGGTYKLTITPSDFNTTSYAANNVVKTSLAVCTTDATKTYEVRWMSNQVMNSRGSFMQWQNSNGCIYNITDLGTITGVTVTSLTGTFTTYYGTEAQPSSGTTPGGGFFQTKVGAAMGATSQLEITFTISSSSTSSECWIETPLASLTASDIFVIVGTNGSGTFAMPNSSGASRAPSAVPVEVEDGRITGFVADSLKWNISGNTSDGYVFYPNGSTTTWLYCTGSNNGVRIGSSTNFPNIFKLSNGYLQHAASSRFVGIYNSQDWRSYTSINNNIAGQSFAFYRYVPQTVTVGTTGYATMVATANLAIPSGLEAYAVQVSGSSARLVPVEDAIPEGEAVVVKASAGTYEFGLASSASAVSGNQLVGATDDVAADGTQYCLADGTLGIGFYKVKPGVTIPAGKAYLVIASPVGQAKAFYGFDDDATAIEMVNSQSSISNGPTYNLAGQRIQKLQHGINIVSGRKVLKR